MTRGRKQAGVRPARVGELIRQELSGMLMNGLVRDPRMETAMVTLTGVEVSADLEHAKVFVSIFTDDVKVREGILEALGHSARMLRRELAARMTMRSTPELHFRYDGSLAYGARIEGLLKSIRDEDRPKADEVEGDDEAEAKAPEPDQP